MYEGESEAIRSVVGCDPAAGIRFGDILRHYRAFHGAITLRGLHGDALTQV